MANSIETIVSQFESIIEAADEDITDAFPYGLKEVTGYNVADIYWDGIENFRQESLGTIILDYRFLITLYIYASDNKTIQTRQKTLGYKIMDAIWDNPDLGGNVDDTKIINVQNGQAESRGKVYAYTEFTVLVTKEETL